MRRICWPPDATCLEGGCGYCEIREPLPVLEIEEWAETAGQVLNRNGGKTQDAMKAFGYGMRNYGGPGKPNVPILCCECHEPIPDGEGVVVCADCADYLRDR